MQCHLFRYLLGFLYKLAGFKSNIKEIKELKARKILHVSAGKTSNFVRTDATVCREQIVNACRPCGKQIPKTGFFFGGNIIYKKTVAVRNIYLFSSLEEQKHFLNEVLYGFKLFLGTFSGKNIFLMKFLTASSFSGNYFRTEYWDKALLIG